MRFNIALALETYYTQNDLCNDDIQAIFGCSKSHVRTLKNQVRDKMAEEDVYPVVYEAKNLNTEYAFRVWGIDIDELERKFKRLVKFQKLRDGA